LFNSLNFATPFIAVMMYQIALVCGLLALPLEGMRLERKSTNAAKVDGAFVPGIPTHRGTAAKDATAQVVEEKTPETAPSLVDAVALEDARKATSYYVGEEYVGPTAADKEPRVEVDENGQEWQEVGAEADFRTVLESLSQADLIQPRKRRFSSKTGYTDALVADSSVLKQADEWLQENPGGVLAIPVGADGPGGKGLNMSTRRAAGGSAQKDPRVGARKSVVMAATNAAEETFVPDAEKRGLMNLILLGSLVGSIGGLAGPFVYYFYPAGVGGSTGGLVAKDALGDDVTFSGWLATHQPGERKLVQGLKGDATYLIVTEDKTIENYGLNAVCTHLGCVVPWNKAENKYMCPCHGSQYNNEGKVVRGPAPLSLALAHVEKGEGDKVTLSPWTEKDFRTGLDPWWK
jgi:cytochrome b6-f complex iron-sulfur subunit